MNRKKDDRQTGLVTDIQRFTTKDGPGVRTTVFLKGCPLRCAWCHNPETQRGGNEVFYHPLRCVGCKSCASVCPAGAHRFDESGSHVFDGARCAGCLKCAKVCLPRAMEPAARQMTAEEVMEIVGADQPFYGSAGGMTLSGGEPMAQPAFSFALLEACQKAGIPTCMETCGYFPEAFAPVLAGRCGLLLWDIKDTDRERHIRFTGADPALIWRNLHSADAAGAKIILRCILVKGVNDDAGHAQAVGRLAAELSGCSRVDILPYHAFGGSKAVLLGRPDNGRREWIPGPEETERFAREVRGFFSAVRTV